MTFPTFKEIDTLVSDSVESRRSFHLAVVNRITAARKGAQKS